jgi:DNA-binding NarL/FixJ family response regulator
MPRILIADDHAIARRGLKEILADSIPLADIDTAASAEELLGKVMQQNWDVVISDINMPGRSGLDILQEINKNFPELPVLIVSVHTEEEYAIRVIKAGGAGFLNKDDAVEEELAKAVKTILSGKKYITPSVAERLADELANKEDKKPHQLLSDRELHIFRLLAKGIGTRDIADKLSLSVNTVGTYRSRILSKMNFKSNAEIIRYAIANDLI